MDFLEKQAQHQLEQLTIYVSPKRRKVQISAKPPSKKEIAVRALRSATVGSAMSGGLPYALFGLKPSGERIPLFGEPVSLMEARKLTEKQLKKVRRVQKGFRAAALAGALLGGGYEVVKGIKQRRALKKHAADDPRKVGKFKNFSTPKILGAPGKTIEQQAAKPTRNIKKVLEKQAYLEVTNAFSRR